MPWVGRIAGISKLSEAVILGYDTVCSCRITGRGLYICTRYMLRYPTATHRQNMQKSYIKDWFFLNDPLMSREGGWWIMEKFSFSVHWSSTMFMFTLPNWGILEYIALEIILNSNHQIVCYERCSNMNQTFYSARLWFQSDV